MDLHSSAAVALTGFESLLLHGAAALYLAGALWGVVALAHPRVFRVAGAHALIVAAVLAQAVFYGAMWRRAGALPVEDIFGVLTFLTWAIALMYLALAAVYRVWTLSAFALPLAALFLAGASALVWTSRRPSAPGAALWPSVHIGTMLFAYAAFAVGFAAGVTYLVGEWRLKRKRPGGALGRLPPLEALDRVTVGAVLVGFACLTFGILAGALWAAERGVPAREWALSAIVLASGAGWAVYAVWLHLRLRQLVRGHRVMLVELLGFGLMSLAAFVVDPVFGGLHRY